MTRGPSKAHPRRAHARAHEIAHYASTNIRRDPIGVLVGLIASRRLFCAPLFGSAAAQCSGTSAPSASSRASLRDVATLGHASFIRHLATSGTARHGTRAADAHPAGLLRAAKDRDDPPGCAPQPGSARLYIVNPLLKTRNAGVIESFRRSGNDRPPPRMAVAHCRFASRPKRLPACTYQCVRGASERSVSLLFHRSPLIERCDEEARQAHTAHALVLCGPYPPCTAPGRTGYSLSVTSSTKA